MGIRRRGPSVEGMWNSVFGGGGEEDEPDAEDGLLRDWQDFKETEETGWSSWNPLSSQPTEPASPRIELTPTQLRNWRVGFGSGCLGLLVTFFFMMPTDEELCKDFSIAICVCTCLCVAGLMAHPQRRAEILKKEHFPAILLLVLALPTVFYSGFAKKSLTAVHAAAVIDLVAIAYITFISDKSSRGWLFMVIGWIRYLLQLLLTGIKAVFWQCVNLVRGKSSS